MVPVALNNVIIINGLGLTTLLLGTNLVAFEDFKLSTFSDSLQPDANYLACSKAFHKVSYIQSLMVYWILPKLCYLGWEAIFRTDCLQSTLHNVAWSIWGRLVSLRVLFLDPTCSMFSWMILTKDCDNLLFEVGPRHQAVW